MSCWVALPQTVRTESDFMKKYTLKHNPNMTNENISQDLVFDKAAVRAKIDEATRELAADITAGRLPEKAQPRPMTLSTVPDSPKGLLKIGLDVHLHQTTFVCQFGNQKPRSARQLTWEKLVERVG